MTLIDSKHAALVNKFIISKAYYQEQFSAKIETSMLFTNGHTYDAMNIHYRGKLIKLRMYKRYLSDETEVFVFMGEEEPGLFNELLFYYRMMSP